MGGELCDCDVSFHFVVQAEFAMMSGVLVRPQLVGPGRRSVKVGQYDFSGGGEAFNHLWRPYIVVKSMSKMCRTGVGMYVGMRLVAR